MGKPKRIKITQIHPEDGWYMIREKFIGQTGVFSPDLEPFQFYRGYFKGRFFPDNQDDPANYVYFLGVRYKKI